MIPKLRIMRRQATYIQQRARHHRLAVGFAAAILAALAPAAAPAAASADPPLIEAASANAGFSGEGLIETQINPEGYETTYKISADCEVPALCQHTEGTLPADNEEHTVSLKLAGLKPGITYHFDIRAANSAGETDWLGELTVPTPSCYPDVCESTAEIPQWSTELANSESAQGVKEYEARQRQLAKEQEEAKAREAARYATEEAELKQAEAQDAQEAATREREEQEAEHPACRVPALKGDTLTVARRALARAHCRLGAVHQPAHRHGALYVSAQGAPAGKRLAHGARVALWCGAKRASRR
jgi:hypothetical protein